MATRDSQSQSTPDNENRGMNALLNLLHPPTNNKTATQLDDILEVEEEPDQQRLHPPLQVITTTTTTANTSCTTPLQSPSGEASQATSIKTPNPFGDEFEHYAVNQEPNYSDHYWRKNSWASTAHQSPDICGPIANR